jgi:hypothetical protein
MDQLSKRAASVPEKFLSERVSALWSSTSTYGKPFNGSLIQAWKIVCEMEAWTPGEFSEGIAHFIRKGGDMPTPGEFANWIAEFRIQQQSKALIAATYENEKRINQQYRNLLLAQNIDPDQIVPTRELAQTLKVLDGAKALPQEESVKSLPDLSDPEKEAQIKAQLEELKAQSEDA